MSSNMMGFDWDIKYLNFDQILRGILSYMLIWKMWKIILNEYWPLINHSNEVFHQEEGVGSFWGDSLSRKSKILFIFFTTVRFFYERKITVILLIKSLLFERFFEYEKVLNRRVPTGRFLDGKLWGSSLEEFYSSVVFKEIFQGF